MQTVPGGSARRTRRALLRGDVRPRTSMRSRHSRRAVPMNRPAMMFARGARTGAALPLDRTWPAGRSTRHGWYFLGMTTRKFAVSFPAGLHAHAQRAAEEAGLSLSAWLARATDHELRSDARIAAGLAAIAELEAEHGAVVRAPRTGHGSTRCSPPPVTTTVSPAEDSHAVGLRRRGVGGGRAPVDTSVDPAPGGTSIPDHADVAGRRARPGLAWSAVRPTSRGSCVAATSCPTPKSWRAPPGGLRGGWDCRCGRRPGRRPCSPACCSRRDL